MFSNYVKVAFRNLTKTRVFSFVNVLGLAIGMTACLLILHYVSFERSYDRFYEDSDRIYRLRYERTDESGESVRFASCCPPAAARIRGSYPEVEKIGRILQFQASVSYEDKKFREERVFFAEPEFLEVLKYDFTEGDPLTGLVEPNRAFVSESTARKYFGDENPVGKTISINKNTDYEIVGVFRDVPANSHLKFDMLLPWKNLEAKLGPEYTEAWGHTGSYTYLRVSPGTDPRAFEGKMAELAIAECPWLKEYNMTMALPMQALTDIHLDSHFMQEYEANGNRDSVETLLLVAIFIMVMAWVNFMNLSTAVSINRAREVGLRKVVGASRRQLMVQFFIEIALTNVIALVCAVGFISMALPYFSQITGMPIEYTPWSQTWFRVAVGSMFAAGVFLSGLYPVLAMSSFKPSTVLKGRLSGTRAGINLRRALVVFQFAVGVVLVVATVTVFQQTSFMRSQDLGFDIEQTLVVRAPRVRDASYGSHFDSFREKLLQRTDIAKMSHVTEVPGRQIYWDAGGIFREGEDVNQGHNYQIVGVDYDFADLFDLEFVAGRNFSREFGSDQQGLMLNETAVQLMGFDTPEGAIGEKVSYWGEIFTVIGVLKDYHQQSLKEEYEPHIFRFTPYGRGSMGMMAIKLNVEQVRETVDAVRRQYDEFFPGNPFDYFFLDDYYNQQYEAEELFGRVYGLFSLLALIIIALGIYGLSSFSITQRTKEIGIHKVLGASVANIFSMLTREFVMLVVVANVIAWPVAWFAMNRWLEGFANRTSMGVATFSLAGVATLLVALVTVSYQVIRAARANPVDAIQHE